METAFVLRSWGATVLRGLLALIFGIVILVWPAATTLVLIVVFGVFALVDGIFSLIEAVLAAGKKEKWGLLLASGLLGLLIGIIVLARPGVAFLALYYLLAIWLIASGAVEIAGAFEIDAPTAAKVLLAFLGLVSGVIGVLLIVYPISGIWTVILLIGIYGVVVGVLRIIFGFMIRSWGRKPTMPAAA
jgi:uncharacterized membrane protein HdeD (DUF308 family)